MKEEFNLFWRNNFKETIPLNFTFRTTYPNRWLRIHSLPNSKRYAENENEINLLLERQNQVISDSIKENQEVYIVRSEINVDYNDTFDLHEEFNFQEVSILNLQDFFDDYNNEDKLSVQVTRTKWKMNCFNSLLEDIANDVSLVFFVSITDLVIFAPYDGGMDIIYQNEMKRNYYKEKYKNYLSQRKDGL